MKLLYYLFQHVYFPSVGDVIGIDQKLIMCVWAS